ncbi:acetate--CoA ligase family protein [Solibacillus cecembensis]|uniref:acetate--CoA ligase family protein n=1 Tax=Solibacillus cecembensis TaxID=459347 RepID=UPI003D0257D8
MTQQVTGYESLKPLLNPKSVAVLGASENKYKIGHLQIQALIDGQFQGEIYPIHPTASEIAGLKSYSSLAEVQSDIDLVIFCVSYNQIKSGLVDCAKKKVKSAIIFAAGFSEAGEEGQKLQEELALYAQEHGIRLVGPNCVGLVNTSNGLIATFSPSFLTVPMDGKKGVGYVSQSGAFGVLTYMAAAQYGVNFNYFVSTGNEMDTSFEDFVEYMLHDDETSIISGYLEGTKKPEKFKQLAKQALNKKKPIVLMKTGRSNAGSRAAASHTGSLAGSDMVYDAFFKQNGIVRAEDFDDIIAFSKLFNTERLPTGNNTVIITSSGGRGINEADRCESYGLNIVELSEVTKSEIRKTLPDYASVSNPIDLTAAASVTNPEFYLEAMKVLVNDPDVDNIIFTDFPFHWDENTPQLQEFVSVAKASNKVIAVFPFPLEGLTYPKATNTLVANDIAVISGALNPVRALSKLVQYSKYVQENDQLSDVAADFGSANNIDALLQPGSTLSESEASEVLDRYGIPTTKRAIAKEAEEAVEMAKTIGFPVVLKIDSPHIPHKTEADAIRLNVSSEEDVRKAFEEVMSNAKNYNPTAKLNGVSVQEMLPNGVEIIVGAHNDETFGPVIMAGLGGVFVEVFKDIAFKVAPLTRKDAIDLLEELQGKAILDGARGKAPVDKEAIIDVLLKVSNLMNDNKETIKELDINPLIVYENGIKAADAMIVVQEKVAEIQVVGG